MTETADPPIAPADLCEIVARHIFDGLPVPISVWLVRGARPWLNLDAADLDEWTDATDATEGTWTPHGELDAYLGRAAGFDLVSTRDHVCEPVK